jgi:hypothetical protein
MSTTNDSPFSDLSSNRASTTVEFLNESDLQIGDQNDIKRPNQEANGRRSLRSQSGDLMDRLPFSA